MIFVLPTFSPGFFHLPHIIVMGNDVLSAGFFLMIVGSFYSFFKDLAIKYYHEFISWFYVSVEVQEGDECYKWLSGTTSTASTLSEFFFFFFLPPWR
jgi:hypothetical protein